jgi:hypothetical protein
MSVSPPSSTSFLSEYWNSNSDAIVPALHDFASFDNEGLHCDGIFYSHCDKVLPKETSPTRDVHLSVADQHDEVVQEHLDDELLHDASPSICSMDDHNERTIRRRRRRSSLTRTSQSTDDPPIIVESLPSESSSSLDINTLTSTVEPVLLKVEQLAQPDVSDPDSPSLAHPSNMETTEKSVPIEIKPTSIGRYRGRSKSFIRFFSYVTCF